MATILPGDITDLVNTTIAKYERNILESAIDGELRDYTAANMMLKGGSLKRDASGGLSYKWDILVKGDSNARNIGLFEVDNLDQVDGTIQADVPWRYMETGCHYDVKQLPPNSGAERIVDFLKTKEYQMWVNYFELMEENCWQGAADGDDDKTPFGIFGYWATYSASEGFNGGNHANFSGGKGGKSATTYPGLKHWTAQYTNVALDDAVAKVRKAMRRSKFRGIPRRPIKEFGDGYNWSYGVYTHDDVLSEWEDIAKDQNDNVGFDVAAADGKSSVRGVPLQECPWITENKGTSKPVVGVNWSKVHLVHPKGEWMRMTPYHQSGTQHEVRQKFVNSSCNLVFNGLRNGLFLVAKSDPTSS